MDKEGDKGIFVPCCCCAEGAGIRGLESFKGEFYFFKFEKFILDNKNYCKFREICNRFLSTVWIIL